MILFNKEKSNLLKFSKKYLFLFKFKLLKEIMFIFYNLYI